MTEGYSRADQSAKEADVKAVMGLQEDAPDQAASEDGGAKAEPPGKEGAETARETTNETTKAAADTAPKSSGRDLIVKEDAKKPGELRVIHVLDRLEENALCRRVVGLAEGMNAAGHGAILVSGGGTMVRAAAEMGLTHIRMPVTSSNPISRYRLVRQLERLIRTEDVDLIHVHGSLRGKTFAAAAERAGIKWVASPLWGEKASKTDKGLLQADLILAQNSAHLSVLKKRSGLREFPARVLADPVKLPASTRSALSTAQVLRAAADVGLTADRLGAEGHVLVVSAEVRDQAHMRSLCARLAELPEAAVAGFIVPLGEATNYAEGTLKRIIADSGLEGRFDLLARPGELATVLALADSYIFAPSTKDVPRQSLLQAMSFGVPTLALPGGEAVDVILDEETGLLAAGGLDDDFVDKARRLIDLDLERRSSLAQEAANLVAQRFLPASWRLRLIDQYKETIDDFAQA
ncbi:MAG: glycosyltransferase family 4 protein [Pseudomonadota bacterium]